jgi:hypothetical protein
VCLCARFKAFEEVWCMEVEEVDDTVFSIVWWECKQIDLLPFLPFFV